MRADLIPLPAHFHHALEWLRQGYSARMVLTGVLFQMTYTSAFGAFAVFVQLRTGMAWSAARSLYIISHLYHSQHPHETLPNISRRALSSSILTGSQPISSLETCLS